MTSTLLGKMSKDLLMPDVILDYLIRSAPYRYKVYQIPKRSGSGMRTIAQPAREVKELQYWVINNVFPLMAVHPTATAYMTGKNIRDNCKTHANNAYLLKLDFKDFFPSIKGEDFSHYMRSNENIQIGEAELQKLIKILFWCPKGQDNLQLSIGAPSSPYLSNAIMYKFDSEIAQYCSSLLVNYTRYADDMTFSMQEKTNRGIVLQKVLDKLNELPFPRLEINNKKTVFGSKAHRRMVTGLIISNDGEVSLGRERKRNIRAQIHRFITGKLSDKEQVKLRGMLAFSRNIEPNFIRRMEKKYGHKVINGI
jgi:hypothetical protein